MRAFANLFGMRDCLFVCWRVVVVVAVWLLLCVCVEFLWFAVCVGCRSSSSRVARLACLLKFLLGRWRSDFLVRIPNQKIGRAPHPVRKEKLSAFLQM